MNQWHPLRRILHWEQARADEIYLTQPLQGGVQDWSWREAVDEARRIARYLQEQQWPAGSRIAIVSKNCAWWVLADFAIWLAGHVSVPVYPSLAGASVRKILDHAGVRAIFVGALDRDDEAAMLAGFPAEVPTICLPLASAAVSGTDWNALLREHAPIESPQRIDDDAAATLIYTSGTTGMPKGALHGFAAIAAAGEILREHFDASAQDRLFSYLPLAHVADRLVSEILSLRCGCRIYFSQGMDSFAADLRAARPTLFFSVPRLWTKFHKSLIDRTSAPETLMQPQQLPADQRQQLLAALGLDRTRVAMSGGAPLPAELMHWYRQLGLTMVEVYGMTENFGLSHITRPGAQREGFIGQPLAGVHARLAADGEVLVRSPGAMREYFREPELTRQAFSADGYLHTGDRGLIDDEQWLRLTGRVKEQFKTSKGKYVAPAPIEALLARHPAVEAVCVLGGGQPQPVAILLPSVAARQAAVEHAGREALEDSLAAHLAQLNIGLDPHERIAFIVISDTAWTVDNGLVTPTLKVKRAAVESRFSGRLDVWSAARATVVWEQAAIPSGTSSA